MNLVVILEFNKNNFFHYSYFSYLDIAEGRKVQNREKPPNRVRVVVVFIFFCLFSKDQSDQNEDLSKCEHFSSSYHQFDVTMSKEEH